MSIRRLLVALVVCALMPAIATLAQTPADSNQRTVDVTGHGDASVKPDAMIVSFAVDSQASIADEATRVHAEKVRKLVDALKDKLGPDAKIETSDYSLNPNTTYIQAPAPAAPTSKTVWDMRASIIVYSESLESLGPLIDGAIAAGASRAYQSGVADMRVDEAASGFFWHRKRHQIKRVTYVILEVHAQGPSAAEVTRKGAPQVAQIKKIAQQQLVDHGIVKLQQFTIGQIDASMAGYPMPTPQPPQQVQNFVTHTTVTADTPKLDLLGPLVQIGLDTGASRLNQVQFTLHNDSDARKEAIEKASAEAKTKAESVAKSMGVTLGKILRISTNAQVRPQVIYGQAYQAVFSAASALHRAEPVSMPVLPHDVGFSADVTVVYEIQ